MATTLQAPPGQEQRAVPPAEKPPVMAGSATMDQVRDFSNTLSFSGIGPAGGNPFKEVMTNPAQAHAKAALAHRLTGAEFDDTRLTGDAGHQVAVALQNPDLKRRLGQLASAGPDEAAAYLKEVGLQAVQGDALATIGLLSSALGGK